MGRPADREDGFGAGQGRIIPGGRNPETGFGNAKGIYAGFYGLRRQRGGAGTGIRDSVVKGWASSANLQQCY